MRSAPDGRKLDHGRAVSWTCRFYTLTETAKLNDLDPRGYLRDVLARIADDPINRIDALLSWKSAAAGTTEELLLKAVKPSRLQSAEDAYLITERREIKHAHIRTQTESNSADQDW